MRSPSVLLRVIVDFLLIEATLVAVVAAEVVLVAAGSSIDALVPGSANRVLLRWIDVLGWWLLLVPTVTIGLLLWRDIYVGKRRYFGEKLLQIALVGGGLVLAWSAILLVFPGLPVPRYGSLIALVAVPVVLVAARATLVILTRGGVVPPLAPRRDHRTPIHSVLIIGGAGYIGSVLTRLLLAHGYKVRVLDSLMYGDESLAALRGSRNFELLVGDMRDLSALVAAAHGVDAIVHLAAIVGDPACELDHDLTLEINLLATRTAREVATALGVKRLIFASTCSVYGATDTIADENSAPKPVSLYGRTKLLSEKLLLTDDHSGLATTVLRFATIYGWSPRPRFDLVVNLFTAQAFEDRRITLHGGNQWRPLLHVRDAARAILSVLEQPVDLIDHQIFNIGGDEENYAIAQIAGVVAREVGAEAVTTPQAQDSRSYRVSFEKARKVLGFERTVTLVEGVRELTEALRSGLVKDFRAPRYSNVQHLTTSLNPALRRDRQLVELAELA